MLANQVEGDHIELALDRMMQIKEQAMLDGQLGNPGFLPATGPVEPLSKSGSFIGQHVFFNAESLTGGLVAATVVEIPGVSAVYRGGLVVYATDLKASLGPSGTLLLDPPDWVETAKVFDLLLAVPKYGRVKVNRILTHCRISPSKTIGGLSERQRNELVSYLRR